MKLPIPLDYPVMEAQSVREIPAGPEWGYEPKWDGFRCLAFRDGDEIDLRSKSGKPLARYFPDVVASLADLGASRFVLDGELVVPVDGALRFDELQLRLHPAESRVRKLAAAHPAVLIAFDLLLSNRGNSLADRPLVVRRERLEGFAGRFFDGDGTRLSPFTNDAGVAQGWLTSSGGETDGVMAKRLDAPYASGERTAMRKIKNLRTADCVVGGFRYASRGAAVGSLLLGLYDEEGRLHHVGYSSSLGKEAFAALTPDLEAIVEPPGFTGNAPGGPSRWSTERSGDWEPLRPILVAEVRYDHFSGGRFRHGTAFLRWRPDKQPGQCTLEQVARESRSSLELIG
ncbi:ATP-dependent DNA ligase [soil metagenome]